MIALIMKATVVPLVIVNLTNHHYTLYVVVVEPPLECSYYGSNQPLLQLFVMLTNQHHTCFYAGTTPSITVFMIALMKATGPLVIVIITNHHYTCLLLKYRTTIGIFVL